MKNNNNHAYKWSLRTEPDLYQVYQKKLQKERRKSIQILSKRIPESNKIWWDTLTESQKEDVYDKYRYSMRKLDSFWKKIKDDVKADPVLYRQNKIKFISDL